jgi:hypothetical protein
MQFYFMCNWNLLAYIILLSIDTYDGDVDAVVSKSTKIILMHSDVSQQVSLL